jgi:hypothetical protein
MHHAQMVKNLSPAQLDLFNATLWGYTKQHLKTQLAQHGYVAQPLFAGGLSAERDAILQKLDQEKLVNLLSITDSLPYAVACMASDLKNVYVEGYTDDDGNPLDDMPEDLLPLEKWGLGTLKISKQIHVEEEGNKEDLDYQSAQDLITHDLIVYTPMGKAKAHLLAKHLQEAGSEPNPYLLGMLLEYKKQDIEFFYSKKDDIPSREFDKQQAFIWLRKNKIDYSPFMHYFY